ncbi:MAG: hypothetical protein NTY46_16850 [Candidatus Sumerlaeota bacterium]|nr:hypothetical protein [Candidatus Sumerlaeota bacterium]
MRKLDFQKFQLRIFRGSIIAICMVLVLAVTALTIRLPATATSLPYLSQFDEPEIMQPALQILRYGDYAPLRSGRIGYGLLNSVLYAGWSALSYSRSMGSPNSPNIWNIQTERDTGYYWTTGSPFIWREARILSVLLLVTALLFLSSAAYALAGPVAAVAAAAFAAFSPPFAQMIYIVADAPALAAASICCWASVAILKNRARWAYTTAAVAGAMAVGFKVNYASVFAFPVCAHFLSAFGMGERRLSNQDFARMGVIAFLLTVLFQIHALRYPWLFLHNFGNEIRAHIEVPPVTGTVGGLLLCYLQKTLIALGAGTIKGATSYSQKSTFLYYTYGTGFVVAFAAALAGSCFRNLKLLLFCLLPFCVAIVLCGNTMVFVFNRHMLPAVPEATILVALGMSKLVGGVDFTKAFLAAPSRKVLRIGWAVVVFGLIYWFPAKTAVQQSSVLANVQDPRVLMFKHISDTLPKGTQIGVALETQWFRQPGEERFPMEFRTLHQMVLNPDTVEKCEYVIVPTGFETRWNSIAQKRLVEEANCIVKDLRPIAEFGGGPTTFGTPPAGAGVKLVRQADLVSKRSCIVTNGFLCGTAFLPVGNSSDVTMGDGPLSVKSGRSVMAGLTLVTPAKSITVRARGTSPFEQTRYPMVTVEVARTTDTLFVKPLYKREIALTRSQGGMSDYTIPCSIIDSQFVVRLGFDDQDKRVILFEGFSAK